MYEYYLGSTEDLSCEAIKYDNYVFKEIDGEPYIFGHGTMRYNKKIYKLKYDTRNYEYQIFSDNAVLFKFIEIWDKLNENRLRDVFSKEHEEFISSENDFSISEKPLEKPKLHYESTGFTLKDYIKYITEFCEIVALPANTHVLLHEDLLNYYEYDPANFLYSDAVIGFSVREFIIWANEIYSIFKKWDKWINFDEYTKQNEFCKYKKNADCDLSYILDRINRLPMSINSEIILNENNIFKEIRYVQNITDIITYQMKCLIINKIDFCKCSNPECHVYFCGRKNKKFCSNACKQKYYRLNQI